jgi:hypothetical protein
LILQFSWNSFLYQNEACLEVPKRLGFHNLNVLCHSQVKENRLLKSEETASFCYKMFKLTQTILTKLRSNNANVSVMKCEKYLKSTIAEAKNTQPNVFEPEIEEEEGSKSRKYVKSHNSMVAAVFASLRPNNQDMEIKTPLTDDKISKATNIDELLSISEGTGISRRHALKVSVYTG